MKQTVLNVFRRSNWSVVTMILGIFCGGSNPSWADSNLIKLDPAQQSANGYYQIAGTWSELKLGWNVLTLKITDSNSNPVTGAELKVTYDMVGMPMNPPDKPVEEKGKGRYNKQVFFGMRGLWRFDLTIHKDIVEDTLLRIENIRN